MPRGRSRCVASPQASSTRRSLSRSSALSERRALTSSASPASRAAPTSASTARSRAPTSTRRCCRTANSAALWPSAAVCVTQRVKPHAGGVVTPCHAPELANPCQRRAAAAAGSRESRPTGERPGTPRLRKRTTTGDTPLNRARARKKEERHGPMHGEKRRTYGSHNAGASAAAAMVGRTRCPLHRARPRCWTRGQERGFAKRWWPEWKFAPPPTDVSAEPLLRCLLKTD